jgi:hypothetical protein
VVGTRESSYTNLTISGAANWEYLTVTYNNGSGMTSVTLYKTSGPDIVGVLQKISNSNVRVNLSASVAFDLLVKYNGNSTGELYTVPAA